QLVAYLLPKNGDALDLAELRAFLKQKLPDYMVPAAFVVLTRFPLAPGGKVDRGALPPPDHVRPGLNTASTQPRTPTEEVLVEIWSDVLGLKQIGIHEDFFELGGHSLLVTQVLSR